MTNISLHDLPNIAQIEAMFLDLEQVLVYNGKAWQCSTESSHHNTAVRFDKFIHEKAKEFVLTLRPRNSILTGKSLKEIVEPHTAHKFILQSDISKYFESIRYEPLIQEVLSKSNFDKELLGRIESFYFDKDQKLKRGLRASAILSEIMGIQMDNLVMKLVYTQEITGVGYSRYYDDILLSADVKEPLRKLEALLKSELSGYNLQINEKKSRLILSENSRVLGLRIHQGKVTVPKEYKRIVRVRAFNFDKEYTSMRQYDWEDEQVLHEMKKKVGSVIGSYWHLVNNSSSDTAFEKAQIEGYMEILGEFNNALKNLYNDIDIFYEEL